MDKDFGVILIFVAVFFIGVSLGVQLDNWIVCKPLAIENGCGQYNSQTGDFEWVKTK